MIVLRSDSGETHVRRHATWGMYAKLWRMNYRFLGKQKTLHLGKWPAVGLAAARAKRDEAREQIAAGMDPAIEKKRARIAARHAAATTFELVAKEWLVKCERDGLAPVTIDKIRWLLDKAYPVIGDLPIAQITPHEALTVLRKIEATGAYESARRMRSVLSRVFRYGVATVRCEKDVAADLRGAIATPKPRHFAAITKPSEVGALLRAIDGPDRLPVRRMAMRLSPHVLLRPGELRQALWCDIDLDDRVWSIPAERMKMRRPHRVPLSRQVISMLEELHALTGHWPHMFTCSIRPRNMMSENVVNQGLRRLGYAEMQVVALPDLYAGKIAAALDRQHPRDLFDILYLYENEGITDDLFKAFLVYLVSHNRPAHELLDPHLLDLESIYFGEFSGMTVEPVPLAALLDVRKRLVADIQERAREGAPAAFLRSFFAGEPDWSQLGLPIDPSRLPAVQWKLQNLGRLRAEQGEKFEDQLARLDEVLVGPEGEQ